MARTYNIGESNERRGLRCRHCGKLIMPTRRERRAKTTRQTCSVCGYSSWELCETSIANIENEVGEEIMSRARVGSSGRKVI